MPTARPPEIDEEKWVRLSAAARVLGALSSRPGRRRALSLPGVSLAREGGDGSGGGGGDGDVNAGVEVEFILDVDYGEERKRPWRCSKEFSWHVYLSFLSSFLLCGLIL